MNDSNQNTNLCWRSVLATVALLAVGLLGGCEMDSFFDPSKTGRFEYTPTVVPILDRLDVIEAGEDTWGDTSDVTTDDLRPNDLTYRMVPGDIVTVSIYELFGAGQWTNQQRRINAGGFFRAPDLGDIMAAGLTAQEFEDSLVELYRPRFVREPRVQVNIDQGGAFTYTVYGFVATPGVFTMSNPDLRLLDALAMAGGVPLTSQRIYIVRDIPLSDDVVPGYQRNRSTGAPPDGPAARETPVDIDDLIETLDDPGAPSGGGTTPPADSGDQPIDIDDVTAPAGTTPPVDVDAVNQPGGDGSEFIYLPERDEWVRVRRGADGSTTVDPGAPAVVIERVIEIDYEKLSKGDSSQNVVVRPRDRIYVEGPESGVIYIDGEIARPGVYNLPGSPRGLTLSRLIAAAGGLGPLAVPERVDLVRMVGGDREAAIRINLAAIRQKTEPDIRLKPDDHIIVGTNFWATPLAVVRNGFRTSYGFGFLLDRNFGNDVFGAPPTNVNR